MTEEVRPEEQKPHELAATLKTLDQQVKEVHGQVDSLKLAYRQAGNNLVATVADDVAMIQEARAEVRRITTILQGTELFGRYAQDADHHRRIADKWRLGAVAILLLAPIVVVYLATVAELGNAALATAMLPILALFVYASVESYNHRRREFDRRRISLRVSAIEAFTKRRREGADAAERLAAELLLNEFIRLHFIRPDLDSNDMSYMGPRFSLVTVLERKTTHQRKRDVRRPRE
ncbi:MAG: hypothetical protein ACM30G_09540 [Micromonosporaceae bacterium]